ncbi:MAG: pyruvate dehydrogenase (acetyl-transferring) E1 component subunit alpha [Chlamydiota bacterium]
MPDKNPIHHSFYPSDPLLVLQSLSRKELLEDLARMLLIRNFETRAEAAYMQGKVGGFFHAYTGQEAIQTAALRAFGFDHWYTTTYRCHALALLLGASPNEVMAELFGKKTGTAKGRGGSMHLYHDQMLGGFGIVGGHVPVAMGAAFASKYKKENKVSLCFLGEGAFAQGAVHESLNYASLWSLPCVIVIENNQWGMGTDVGRAICSQPIAEHFAPAYNMRGFTLNGMDYANCVAGFQEIFRSVQQDGKPVLVEAVAERFKGHSISDPGLYRSKDEVATIKKQDPILLLKDYLTQGKMLSEKEFQTMDEEQKQIVLKALTFADESPFPDTTELEEGVLEWEP